LSPKLDETKGKKAIMISLKTKKGGIIAFSLGEKEGGEKKGVLSG